MATETKQEKTKYQRMIKAVEDGLSDDDLEGGPDVMSTFLDNLMSGLFFHEERGGFSRRDWYLFLIVQAGIPGMHFGKINKNFVMDSDKLATCLSTFRKRWPNDCCLPEINVQDDDKLKGDVDKFNKIYNEYQKLIRELDRPVSPTSLGGRVLLKLAQTLYKWRVFMLLVAILGGGMLGIAAVIVALNNTAAAAIMGITAGVILGVYFLLYNVLYSIVNPQDGDPNRWYQILPLSELAEQHRALINNFITKLKAELGLALDLKEIAQLDELNQKIQHFMSYPHGKDIDALLSFLRQERSEFMKPFMANAQERLFEILSNIQAALAPHVDLLTPLLVIESKGDVQLTAMQRAVQDIPPVAETNSSRFLGAPRPPIAGSPSQAPSPSKGQYFEPPL